MSSMLPDGTPAAGAPVAVTPASPGASPVAGARVGATLPAPEPHRRSRRTKISLAVTASLAFIAGVVVVVINPPHGPYVPPVLRPAGLSAEPLGYTSVVLNWYGPRTGPLPTSYWIFQDGSQIGSVSGRVTTYQATGLLLNTRYEYQVLAIRQHLLSPLSVPVTVLTLTPPPLSDAELTGPFTVSYSHITSYGYIHSVRQLPGDDWNLTPRCSYELCPVVIHGTFWGFYFTATLHRHGTVYQGTAVIKKFNKCSDVTSALPLYLTYHLTIRGAVADGSQWTASSWDGTVQATQPLTACAATGITAKIRGAVIGGAPQPGGFAPGQSA